jgi:hypothetical protein
VFADREIVSATFHTLAQALEKVKPSLADRLGAALDAIEQGVTALCEQGPGLLIGDPPGAPPLRERPSGHPPWQASRDTENVRPPRENHRVTTVVEEHTQSRVSELLDVPRAAEADWRRCQARMLDVISQLGRKERVRPLGSARQPGYWPGCSTSRRANHTPASCSPRGRA